MRSTRRLALLVSMLGLLGTAVPAARAAAPVVAIGTSPRLDAVCSVVRRYPIDGRWRRELETLLPTAQHRWSTEQRPVFESMARLAGVSPAASHKVRLTICDLPSTSRPVALVNMRHALRSFTGRPVPLRYKLSVITHELGHALIAERDLSRSRLLTRHRPEPARVRDHLHLFALMKAAYLAHGNSAALREMQRIDADLPDPSYRRAWAIVEATPTAYRPFVEELRKAR